jgi:hypothetical protein
MQLQCWKCGSALTDIIFPFSRREECRHCNADQHVCFLCKEYDESVSDSCREDRADFVLDKDKANFCDYFQPRPNAYNEKQPSKTADARSKLAELFGEEQDEGPTDSLNKNEELKRLFDD